MNRGEWKNIDNAETGIYYYCVEDANDTTNPFSYEIAIKSDDGVWKNVHGDVGYPIMFFDGDGRPPNVDSFV
jgi:hypothetical protein